MQVYVHASVGKCAAPYGGTSVVASEKAITIKLPAALVEAGFPAPEATFPSTNVAPSVLTTTYAASCAQGLTGDATNHVVFGYGQSYSAKRDQLFGAQNGFANAVLQRVGAAAAAAPQQKYAVMCYGVNNGDELTDFIDASNTDGIILDHPQEGPRVSKIERKRISSAADAVSLFSLIASNIAKYFEAVQAPPSTPEDQALPPFIGTTVVMAIHRYDGDDEYEMVKDANSIHIIALADTNRPVLCGVEATQQSDWESSQRILAAVCGIVVAINCNRLRVPYGKTKLTTMLKRAYNAEKNGSKDNKPTVTIFWMHVLDDEGNAEEAYHTLCTLRRCVNLAGGAAVGSVTRDLAADKWRVEQDILELKDELAIAKAVHDYKPCIYDQPKPVPNVAEEVKKRVEAIRKKRAEARQKAELELEKRAAEEAEKYIAQLEKESGKTMADLERQLKELQDEKVRLEIDRNKKREEHEKHLGKIQRKRDEEDAAAQKLRAEVENLEAELKAKRELVGKKRAQLEAASEDQAKGRESILKEREEIRETRAKLYVKRREERAKWLEEIRSANERLLTQVAALAKARAEVTAAGLAPEGEDESEATIRADIDSINEYLPKLVSLEDVPADADSTEAIRRQLQDYFEDELKDYTAKVEEEKKKLAALQSHVEMYRSKLEEHHSKQKKEMLNEALKKENHLQSLVDQVIQYLQHGHCMYKVSSTGNVRYRFFFLTEDCKRMCSCELDENGMAVNRRKPTSTIVLRDVVKVSLGMYTPSFLNYAGGDSVLRPVRESAMRDDGYSLVTLTPPLDPKTLGKFNYRAFALELNNGKTLELVCETDSDCEAWVVALKRLFNYRTEYERRTTRSAKEQTAEFRWGAPLDIKNRAGAKRLTTDEAAFCEDFHIPPMLFLTTRDSVAAKSQNSYVTVYDVRVVSKLDLLRAQQLHEFFIDHRVIPPPRS